MRRLRRLSLIRLSLPLMAFFMAQTLSGCSLIPVQKTPAGTDEPPYRPATLVPSPTPTSKPTVAPTDPARPSANCTNSLTFITDLTIPDGTEIVPQATLDKRWEVENSGTCNWDDGYRLRHMAGPDLGSPEEQALYPARSGTRATIRLVLEAPKDTGTYHSVWQAYSPEGQPFGDPIYIDFTVIP